ncbi:ABC transporter substrate-binding protein [Acrocarpospora macrocephala]|uniref:Sugar ABC transporter substrate-binding protein n=1 Tax=Acrocarpospora macrocephala TaxID=150177 RepID=A0A5M3WY94_9ACTN|nr:extracellular solute-binding protein [Acrocarpospora macrocephala]GES14465.1 sugar ABC transporter substrate-binding protein [Acrocarpospora macrocephala]
MRTPRSPWHTRAALAAAASLIAITGCSAGEPGAGPSPSRGGTLTVAAVWTGKEQQTFQTLLDDFKARTGVTAEYVATGDDIAAVLGTKIQGGSPPDIGVLPQPGLMGQFAKAGNLKSASADVAAAVKAGYGSIWTELGSVDGTLYGVWVDASNKSTVWYRTGAFAEAGITRAPATWPEFLQAAQTLSDSGVTTPVSIGGADGWTLTDWFENVYIRTAGLENYDKLAKHQIPWTDPTVTAALDTLKGLWSNRALVGDPAKALQADFPTSVANAFSDRPTSAIVYEGSFVAGAIASSTGSKVGEDAKFFPFPSINDSPPVVVGGGNVAVAFTDNPASQRFLAYLATPEAAKLMVAGGGFTSANKALDAAAYPDETSRQIGQQIVAAGDNFRFDMSDLAPSAFGGTKGSGEFKDLQDFLAGQDVQAAQRQLEADAKAAYSGQ